MLEEASATNARVAADLAIAIIRRQMEESAAQHALELTKQNELLLASEASRLLAARLLAQEQAEVQRLRYLLEKSGVEAAARADEPGGDNEECIDSDCCGGVTAVPGTSAWYKRETMSGMLDEADGVGLQWEVQSLRSALAHSERLRREAELEHAEALADAVEERSNLEKQCEQLQTDAEQAWHEARVYISSFRYR
jgi:hypothetical protein